MVFVVVENEFRRGGRVSWKFRFPPLIVLGEKDVVPAMHPLYPHRSRVQ